MNLKEIVEKHFAAVFNAHKLNFAGSQLGGRDGKTGEACDSLEFSSALFRLRIERSDGEINARLWHTSWERWRYVREFSVPGPRDESIEDLLVRVPDRPLSDEEMLERLAPHVAAALEHVENLET